MRPLASCLSAKAQAAQFKLCWKTGQTGFEGLARFLDASAIVPLCFREAATAVCESLAEQYPIVAWWGTSVECHGAFRRLARTGHLTADKEFRATLLRFHDLQNKWNEIPPSDRVRERAVALLDRHTLRAADALQLAAALEWRPTGTGVADFISGDRQLLAAAQAEGFAVHSTA